MKRTLLLLLLPLLLTSCSNPDTSGGVTLSKGADDANEYPHGGCDGPGTNPHTYDHGCGWISVNDESYYIMSDVDLYRADLSYANLRGAFLSRANLRGANLSGADLSGAYLSGADLNHALLIGAILWSADVSYANLRGMVLRGANLRSVLANSFTICPNGIYWGTAGNDCPF